MREDHGCCSDFLRDGYSLERHCHFESERSDTGITVSLICNCLLLPENMDTYIHRTRVHSSRSSTILISWRTSRRTASGTSLISARKKKE